MLETGVTKMMRSLGEVAGGEGQEAAAALKIMHINVKDIIDLHSDKQFSIIAEAISKLDNRTDRVNATMSIFGKGGAELLNVIGQGAKGIDEAAGYLDKMGLSISEVDAEKLVEADKGMKLLSESVEGLYREFAVELVPSIKSATDALTEFISKKGGLAKKGGSDVGFLEAAGGVAKLAGNAVKYEFAGVQGILGAGVWAAGGGTGMGVAAKQNAIEGKAGFKAAWHDLIEGPAQGGLNPGDNPHPNAITKTAEKSGASLAAAAKEAGKMTKELADMDSEADKLNTAFETPLEKVREQFGQVWDLFEAGAEISEETVSRAFAKIGEENDKLREKLNKPYEEFEKGLHDAADRMHEELETPLEKMNQQISKIQNNPFLSDVDKKRGIDKATKEYQDQISKRLSTKR